MTAEPAGAAELLVIAEEAARAAGAELAEHFEREHHHVSTKSSKTDPVSDADHAAEDAIRALLQARRPDDAILGEEGGDTPGQSGMRWVIDPLDGTVNFLFGIPHWCVSVACEDAQGTLAGAVLDPLRDELFLASRGGPALLDGAPAEPSQREDLSMALVGTGYAYDANVRARQAEATARVLPAVRDLRRLGSAALDLAYVACGRYDAFYERGLKAWDVAAGALLCRRAGIEVRDLEPEAGLPSGLVVAPPGLIEELDRLVRG